MKPLVVDLYCGLGGWAEGFLASGYRVVGFDIERHDYGTGVYPGQLVIQDVLTLHGKQFKDAAVIVGSPPCQKYSYMAMPWSKAKAIAADYRDGRRCVKELNALFDACFRIQREASEAAGRHIPLIVENVRGAQPWVGRSKWNYGSFHLWGDVPALMPISRSGERKSPVGSWYVTRKNYTADHSWKPDEGYKSKGLNWSDQNKRGQDFTRVAGRQAAVNENWRMQSENVSADGVKVGGTSEIGSNFSWNLNEDFQAQRREVIKVGQAAERRWEDRPVKRLRDAPLPEGTKVGGDWFGRERESSVSRLYGSKSVKRKAASAQIAKIPFPLAYHLAQVYYPHAEYNRGHETPIISAVDSDEPVRGADVHLPLPGVQ